MEPTWELAYCPELLKDQEVDFQRLDAQDILDRVARKMRVSPKELPSHHRTDQIAFARAMAMYLLREVMELSYPAIGKILNRDHSTAIHGHNLIATRMYGSPEFSRMVNSFISELGAR